MQTMTDETYTKILDDLTFARDGLRQALTTCTAVEGLLLMPLIGRTVELRRDIAALAAAVEDERV
jgi:hypothetical protein